MLRVIVCGGRDFSNIPLDHHKRKNNPIIIKAKKEYKFVHKTLDKIFLDRGIINDERWLPIVHIISGAATGVDTTAIDYAVVNWAPFSKFPADWAKYGNSAGPIRNKQMLEEGKPDLVIAFPGGNGTKNMIHQAKKAGVETIEVAYNPDE